MFELNKRQQINMVHVLLVAPLLIYFGMLKDCNAFQKNKAILLVLGLLVLVYHLYRLVS
jgi:hypothetical protein